MGYGKLFYNICSIFLNYIACVYRSYLQEHNFILILVFVVILTMFSFCPAERDGSKVYLVNKPISRLKVNQT